MHPLQLKHRKVTVKRVAYSDLAQTMSLLTLAAQVNPETFSAQWVSSGDALGRVTDRLEKRLGLIAYREDSTTEAVGFLGWRMRRNQTPTQTETYSEIETLFVIPRYRRHGLAKSLCESYVLLSRQQGIRDIRVTTDAIDQNAQLFKVLGFTSMKLVLQYDG